jgi:DNA-binding MarR family transcriptional regulator
VRRPGSRRSDSGFFCEVGLFRGVSIVSIPEQRGLLRIMLAIESTPEVISGQRDRISCATISQKIDRRLAFIVSLLTIRRLTFSHAAFMPFLLLKNLPRYECLLEAAKQFPDLDPSATEVFLHLLQTGDDAFRLVESHLAAHNISQGRFVVLMLLLNKSTHCPHPRTPAELADMSRVTRATMTGLIDTLERDGLVKREPDLNDRRMMSVNLTPKGHALLEKILPKHFQRMAELMQPLSEDERKTLVQLLGKISHRAAEVTPASSRPSVTLAS